MCITNVYFPAQHTHTRHQKQPSHSTLKLQNKKKKSRRKKLTHPPSQSSVVWEQFLGHPQGACVDAHVAPNNSTEWVIRACPVDRAAYAALPTGHARITHSVLLGVGGGGGGGGQHEHPHRHLGVPQKLLPHYTALVHTSPMPRDRPAHFYNHPFLLCSSVNRACTDNPFGTVVGGNMSIHTGTLGCPRNCSHTTLLLYFSASAPIWVGGW